MSGLTSAEVDWNSLQDVERHILFSITLSSDPRGEVFPKDQLSIISMLAKNGFVTWTYADEKHETFRVKLTVVGQEALEAGYYGQSTT